LINDMLEFFFRFRAGAANKLGNEMIVRHSSQLLSVDFASLHRLRRRRDLTIASLKEGSGRVVHSSMIFLDSRNPHETLPWIRVLSDQQPRRDGIAFARDVRQQAALPEPIVVAAEPVILHNDSERRWRAVALTEKSIVCGYAVCAKE